MLKLSRKKYIKTLIFFWAFTNCFAENIDFLQLHNLNNGNKIYSYPMNVSVGILINDLPIFNGNLNSNVNEISNEISKTTLKHVFGIGIDFKISPVITNIFCAKTFGFFPKTGLLVQGFSMNYGRELLKSFATSLVSLCKLNPQWHFKPNENCNFNINIIWFHEPETNIFKKYRFIPRIGIGASISNLHHDYDADCKHKVNPCLIDLCLLNGILFVIKKKYCDIEFNVGYTYNPLFHIDANTRNVTGGIINFYTGVNFSFYTNLGLESLDWFDEDFIKNKYHHKKKLFIDILYGLGNWYTCNNPNQVTSKKYCQVLASFSWPYLSKITDEFFYGMGIDISEDFRKTSENNNIAAITINNFNLVFNFAQFAFDYKAVRFSHNFGVYVITNLYNTFKNAEMKHFGQREISEQAATNVDKNTTWIDYLTGRFTYRPRVYINVFKMIRKKEKFNFLDKLAIVIGINSIILNHRNDFTLVTVNKNSTALSANIEFLKIEGFFIGISLKV